MSRCDKILNATDVFVVQEIEMYVKFIFIYAISISRTERKKM